MSDLGKCPECGIALYLTPRGMLRRHQPRNVRQGMPECPGSGKPGEPIERSRG